MSTEEQKQPPVTGDQVGGDKFEVAIENSHAVAIGAGARATLNQYTEIIVKIDTLEDLPPAPGTPPYKGLAYFIEQDKDIFFGREKLSDHLAHRVSESHFLAVIGASGSGKSSLLRAGLIPRLRQRNWLIQIIKPGHHPLTALANSLTQEESSLTAAQEVTQALFSQTNTLTLVGNKLAARQQAEKVLLVVDQFEELLTQCKDPDERQAFVANLLHTIEAQGATSILISMRADFYDRITEFRTLSTLISQQQELILPMDDESLVRVIAEPAKRGGWQFVEGLLEQIVDDVGQEPGRLPLLSHALLETWERRRGVTMTLGGYRDAGGVEGAIAHTAEETLNRLSVDQLTVARELFLNLTELGEGAEDTRRIASREELLGGTDAATLDGVIETMVRARLITTSKGEVEVAHEALIRRWPTLKEWLADNRERLRFERQMARDAGEWEEAGHDPGILYRGSRLAQAQENLSQLQGVLPPLSHRFIEASLEAQAEQEQAAADQIQKEEKLRQEQANASRFRRLTRWLSVAAGVAVVAAIIALLLANRAVESESRAIAAQAKSDANAALAVTREAEARFAEGEARIAEAASEANAALASTREAEARVAEGEARIAEADSEANAALASTREAEAVSARQELETLKIAIQSLQLASQAEIALQNDNQQLALLLATVALQNTYRVNGTAVGEVRVILCEALSYSCGARLYGHTDRIYEAEFNSLGTRFITISQNEARLWDGTTGEQVNTLIGHDGAITRVAFDPSGTYIVSGSSDGTVGLWDAETGNSLRIFTAHEHLITTVAVSPDAQTILTSSFDGTARLWDSATSDVTHVFNHEDWVSSASFSPDGQTVLTVSVDGSARLWDLFGQLLWWFFHLDRVNSAMFSSDGQMIVTASNDGTVRLWDVLTGDLVTELPHDSAVLSAIISPDGQFVLTAAEGKAKLWTSQGEIFMDHPDYDFASFSPDGKQLLLVTTNNTAHLIRLGQRK